MTKDAYTLSTPDGSNSMELPARSGTLGPKVLDIGRLYRELGVFTYDPGFVATGSCDSDITFIDGEKGVLLYRGVPVEQLAAQSSFIEVCYLLLYGELPTAAQLEQFDTSITRHTMLNEGMLRFFNGFRYDAHPMAMVSAVVGSMSAYYHDTMDIRSQTQREIFSHRILAKLPTIAAAAYKKSIGQPFIYPRNDLSYSENLLNMLFAVPAEPYDIDPGCRGGDRSAVHSARRPRAELFDLRRPDGGQLRRKPVLSDCGRRVCPVGAGARRRQRGGAEHARRDWRYEQHSKVHRQG